MAFGKLGSLGAGFGREGGSGGMAVPPPPPDGYVYYVNLDGRYLTDLNGNFLIGPA